MKKQRLSQTRSIEWDQILPPQPKNQEPIAQSDIPDDISSILSSLDRSKDQEIAQAQLPDEPPAIDLVNGPVIDEDQILIPHPLMNETFRQPEPTQDHILDKSKFPNYAYSIPSGRARSGWI